ncbi:hypothetical protein CEXT_87321 [Caerostris extrusa]|uniref:Uncharacterized protein n=1 Tax=Caerostris extrusa TaxID=172846 RepID=A0AAV4WJP3_CAEEX|nr:hypothetical protein CEXT_87321 [Caerostris extrusa]
MKWRLKEKPVTSPEKCIQAANNEKTFRSVVAGRRWLRNTAEPAASSSLRELLRNRCEMLQLFYCLPVHYGSHLRSTALGRPKRKIISKPFVSADNTAVASTFGKLTMPKY